MTLLDHIELALLEIKAGYELQCIQTLSAIIKDLKEGNFDNICPNCNCVVEIRNE